MILAKVAPKAGFMKDSTEYAAMGTWWDGDKVRFRNGLPESIGGWQPMTSSAMAGSCRCMFQWSALSGAQYLALGTNKKMYAETGASIRDITPIRKTSSLGTNPLSASGSNNLITVADSSHGASVGDYITISGAAGFGGVLAGTLNAEFPVYSVIDANSYTIDIGQTASASAGGGASVSVAYQLPIGLDTTVYGTGFGAGLWGRGTWNSAATTTASSGSLRLWSATNFGEDLVINPRGGAIYWWDTSAAARAVDITSLAGSSNAPTQALEVLVSGSDRHLLAFGCTDISTGILDPLLIRWPDTESLTDWLPKSTNTAGDIRIPYGSKFVTSRQTRNEILVWTDSSLHSLQFVGAPYTYGISTLATNTSIMGPKAKVSVFDVVYWWGADGFFTYDGRVHPMPCSVRKAVMDNLNTQQSDKVYGYVNSGFNEVGWVYPSAGSSECDSYVVYNYVDKTWTTGTIARTAWIDRGQEQYPLATGTDGILYYHEVGYDAVTPSGTSAIDAYIESGPIEISEGEQMMFVARMIPDISFRTSTAASPSATFTITPSRYPGAGPGTTSDNAVVRSAVVPVEKFTGVCPVRVRGRSVTLKVRSNAVGVGWRLGIPRLEMRTDGRR